MQKLKEFKNILGKSEQSIRKHTTMTDQGFKGF